MEVTSLTNDFASIAEAEAYMAAEIDRPVEEWQECIDDRLIFSAFSSMMADGRFTNVYDISYRAGDVVPAVRISRGMDGVYQHLENTPRALAAASGTFFYHSTKDEGRRPRQLAYNMAIEEGKIQSLPVTDREAVICVDNRLSARHVRALGLLSIDGVQMSWSGSLTDYDTDCRVFGMPNCAIRRVPCEVNGSKRIVVDDSAYTPPMDEKGSIDIGFVAHPIGGLVAKDYSRAGRLSLFEHDMIVRCRESRLVSPTPVSLTVHTIDDLDASAIQGALTAGPLLGTADLATHPINTDISLGGVPPFTDRPAARMAMYEANDGMVHVRMFDGRPDSDNFKGVTPNEVVRLIGEEGAIRWGCFLDGGYTARVCIRTDDEIRGYGNAHYLQWPDRKGQRYRWASKRGRPTPSFLTFH